MLIYSLLAITAAVLFYKTLIFILSQVLKRNDIADVSWGLSFIVVLASVYFISQNQSPRFLIISTLITVWAIRLAVRIYLKNRNKKEDFRYKAMRKKFGKHPALNSYLRVFVTQGLFSVVVALPLVTVGLYGFSNLTALDVVGIAVWTIGFIFEVVGDYQLDQFKKKSNSKNKILKTGLWKYSRHPNYFGEITMWWGIFIMSLSVPLIWLSIFGPLTITILLTKVSGIPLLEKRYKGNKDFEKYKEKTSVLIPLPPRA